VLLLGLLFRGGRFSGKCGETYSIGRAVGPRVF
jgi:hypothetical protein